MERHLENDELLSATAENHVIVCDVVVCDVVVCDSVACNVKMLPW